ncbi:MAG: ABC transporter permease [Gemmatimonadaceae bacterium]|nr:ABC transporter permease [Gemmatimonadaceae bacterium]
MTFIAAIARRLGALFDRRRADREFDEEAQFHLDMLSQRLEREGAAPHEARRRARAHFGGVRGLGDDMREARGTLFIDDLARDVRFGVRQLLAHPVFTAVVTVTLALGIGATSAIFSVVDHVLLRPAAFAEPERLVMLWGTDSASGTTREPIAWPDLVDFRARSRTITSAAAIIGAQASLAIAGAEPSRATIVAATSNTFQTLGVRPLIGRAFTDAEDVPGGPAVALIGESLWRVRFGADAGVIGRTILVDEAQTQIIGVVPDGADFGIDQMNQRAAYHQPYTPAGPVDLWVPVQGDPQRYPRSTHPLLAFGRLAPGATVVTAQSDLGAIAAELERTYPENAARGVHVESFDDVVLGPSRPLLNVLLAAVALLLVVATVNVANLLLARGTARVREVALRGALGASSVRLTRQFIAEGAVLVGLGTMAGLGAAWFVLRLLRTYGPADVPRLDGASLDWRAVALTFLVGAVVGLIFGLVPVVSAFRSDTMAVLKGEGNATGMSRGGVRLRDGLVVVQLTLCVALAICASLVTRSFAQVMRIDPGFTSAGVLKAQYVLPSARYPRDFAQFPRFVEITQFTDRLLAQAAAIPGVQSAAIAAAHPLDAGFTNSWRVVGREAEASGWPEISLRLVSPGYFETMGLARTSGRGFGAGDDASGPAVALINETAARRFFGGADPVGQEIEFWGIRRRVVGVVADERIHGLTTAAPPAAYVPLAQIPSATGVLLVRTRGDVSTLAAPVRGAIAAIDPQLAVFGIEPFSATLADTLAQRKFAMFVLGAFALVTIVLAVVGVHGVVSYAAVQRTREIGIRQALGATRLEVIGLVLRGTALLALVGVAAGVAAAAAGSGVLASLLYGVSRFDPLTFVVVPLAVAGVALLSSWLPARRAAVTSPLVAIRS